MLRVALVAANCGRIGDAMRAVATGKALARRGHRVTVIYSKKDRSIGYRQYEEDGIQVVESPRLLNPNRYNGFQNPFAILANLCWLATHPYDVYHAFVPVDNVGIPWLVWKRFNPRAIFIFDQSDLVVDGGFLGSLDEKHGLARLSYRVAAWTERTVKKQADACFVLSSPLRERTITQGVESKRIHLIRTGVMVRDLFPQISKDQARLYAGIKYDGLLLGFASTHLAGLTELLDGMEILAKSETEFRILFTGSQSDQVRRQIEKRGLKDLVFYTGFLDDENFWVHMSACDMFLTLMDDTPSCYYCFPSKLVSYMAVGRPVIVTDIGDAGDFVRSYACGIAYPVGGANLALAVHALASDPDGARRMGVRGREAVGRDLSWEVLGEKIEQVYYQVMDDRTRRGSGGLDSGSAR